MRSPHAFARIVSVDIEAARNAPGVVAVLTAKDMDGVGNVGRHPPIPGRGGKKLVMPHRPALAGERVMHVGEPVAMVVAETAAAAQDAAELVAVDYEELTPVIDARERCATARRNCGRRRPATSRSTGRGRIPIPTPMPRRSTHHRLGHACRAGRA